MAKKKQDSTKKKKGLRDLKSSKKALVPKFSKNLLIGSAIVIAITLFCFVQTKDYGFVNWDDDRNIFKNEQITTINSENFWKNTKDIWTSTVIGNYNPLTIWTFAIEKMTYGMDQIGKWHMTNVFLHLICVLLVLRICLLLGLSWRGALFVAMLFGIHPMRVESVAWLTERKDVLYGAFYLGAILLYVKGRRFGKSYFIPIVLLFILSLFSKIQAVILPISFILVDYLLDGRFQKKTIISKLPLVVISLVFGLLGIYFLSDEGSIGTNSNTYDSWQRIFVGSYSYLVYLVKSIIPYRLSPLYPYPAVVPWYFYASIAIVPAAIYALWWAYKRERRVLFFGLAFFSVNIFFLLQILGAGQGFLADRFTYIAYFGLFFIAGHGLDHFWNRYPAKRIIFSGAIAVLLSVYTFMTYQQTKIWENSDTLWSHVLKYYQNSTLPWGNRANYLRDDGQSYAALRDYNKAISLNPSGEQAYNSRARLYFNIAKGQDTLLLALRDYSKAIELEPNDGEFYVNRGATYARLGRTQEAINDISKGLELKPDHATGYLNRSIMYNSMGNIPKALADIESYLMLRPYESDLWYEKARALRQLDRVREALTAYDRAIQINASKGMYWYERARTKSALGDATGAKSDLGRAIGLGFKNIDPAFRQRVGL